MMTRERSIWLIDKSVRRLTVIHNNLIVIWTFYVILVAFHIFLYSQGLTQMRWTTTPLLPVLGIWFLIVFFRPDSVLTWGCKMGRLHPDSYPYLKKVAGELAWNLRGRRI